MGSWERVDVGGDMAADVGFTSIFLDVDPDGSFVLTTESEQPRPALHGSCTSEGRLLALRGKDVAALIKSAIFHNDTIRLSIARSVVVLRRANEAS